MRIAAANGKKTAQGIGKGSGSRAAGVRLPPVAKHAQQVFDKGSGSGVASLVILVNALAESGMTE